MMQRARSHRRESKWFDDSLGVITENYSSGYIAAEAELYAILTEAPEHNGRFNGYTGVARSAESAMRSVLSRAEYEARRENAFRNQPPDEIGHIEVTVTIHGSHLPELEQVVGRMQTRKWVHVSEYWA